MAKFEKGHPGGPGRPKLGSRLDNMVIFDLKQAARSQSPEALEVLVKAMRSGDERIAVMGALAILERAYGKPEQKADVTTTHKFAVVPSTMEENLWLQRRGQPILEIVPPTKPNGSNGSGNGSH